MTTLKPPTSRTQLDQWAATDHPHKALWEAVTVLADAGMVQFTPTFPNVALITDERLPTGHQQAAVAAMPGILARLREQYGATTLHLIPSPEVELSVAKYAHTDGHFTVVAHPGHSTRLTPGIRRRWTLVASAAEPVADPRQVLAQQCDTAIVVWAGDPNSVSAKFAGEVLDMGKPVIRFDPATRQLSSRGEWT